MCSQKLQLYETALVSVCVRVSVFAMDHRGVKYMNK